MWKYPRPQTWQAFEQILADWVQNALEDTAADRYGRAGQRQNGIDILARNWRQAPPGTTPQIWAIQAKHYDQAKVSPSDAHLELTKALSHSPRPDVFVLATTGERDARLQDWAIAASKDLSPTRVEVWFWDGLVEQCLKESWFRDKYLTAFWASRIPHQLPSPPADFTGRDSEISEAVMRLEGGVNTVVLSGMGGVGKTAAGLAIAHRIAARYPDGQVRIDLRGTNTDGRLGATEAMLQVVRTFDAQSVALASSADIENLYQTTLHGKRVLLFLDDAYDAQQVQPYRLI